MATSRKRKTPLLPVQCKLFSGVATEVEREFNNWLTENYNCSPPKAMVISCYTFVVDRVVTIKVMYAVVDAKTAKTVDWIQPWTA